MVNLLYHGSAYNSIRNSSASMYRLVEDSAVDVNHSIVSFSSSFFDFIIYLFAMVRQPVDNPLYQSIKLP